MGTYFNVFLCYATGAGRYFFKFVRLKVSNYGGGGQTRVPCLERKGEFQKFHLQPESTT